MAALGSQSIASSYEQLLHVDRDGGGNTTTHVSIKDGDNGTTFGFTIASDALMMTSTNRLEFGDTGTYIHQSADGVLDLVSDTEIELTATTIDLNGAADLSGNLTVGGDIDLEGSIDVNGTTNLDAVDIDGAVQIDAAVTVGADDQGYDFKFFGDTASAYMMWDTSADDLVFAGAAGIDLDGDIDVNGTANLDNTDIDGTLAVDGTTISLDATTSFNIDNSNTSNGITIGTATSGVPISIGHTTSETTVNDNLVVTGDIDLEGSIDVNGTANLDGVDIDGAVDMASTLQVDGAITCSTASTITTADNLDTLSLVSTDTDANSGPNLRLYRNSGNPAVSDAIGFIQLEGRNDNSQDVVYNSIESYIVDETDGTEDAEFVIRGMVNGTLANRLQMSNTETNINQEGIDVDFRVESDGNANMLFVDAGNNKVGIGTSSPSEMLHCASDGIFDGNVKIDSDTKGLVLGADQDVTLFADAIGSAYFARGTDVTPVGGDTEGWILLHMGDNDETYVSINGGEGGAAQLYMAADNGDDNADNWRLDASVGGDFLLSSKSTGSFVTNLSVGGDGSHVRSLQPAFQVHPASDQTNFAENTPVTVVWGTERFDQGANFASNTFTSPRSAKYQFNVSLYIQTLDLGYDYYELRLVTSNKTYFSIMDPNSLDANAEYWTLHLSILADMDTNDTVSVAIHAGGTGGGAGHDLTTHSMFSGYLAC